MGFVIKCIRHNPYEVTYKIQIVGYYAFFIYFRLANILHVNKFSKKKIWNVARKLKPLNNDGLYNKLSVI